MKKILVVIGFVLLTLFPAAAQFPFTRKYNADSLELALKREKSVEVKARLNGLLSLYWSLVDVEKAKPYLQQFQKLNPRSPFLRAVEPYCEAYICWDTDPERSAALFVEVSQNMLRFKTPEAFFLSAKSLRNYALHQQTKDNTKGYIDALLKAIPIAKQSNDSTMIGMLHQDVAMTFMNDGQWDKSGEYYKTAIAYYQNKNTPYADLAKAYCLLVENYAFAKKNFSEAKLMLDKAKKILSGKPITVVNAEYCLAEGMYYKALKDFAGSLKSFDEGIAIAKSIQDAYMIKQMSYQKYFIYQEQRNYSAALATLFEFMKAEPNLSIHNRQRVYFDLSETYAGMGQMPRAYQWLKQYSTIRDSVYDTNLKQEIGAMEVKFKNVENKKKIAELEAEKKEEALKAKNNRLFSWLLGIGCLGLAVVAAAAYQLNRKNKKLAKQQLKEIEQQQELKLTQAMLQGEERERQRVARDLHDGIGGLLAGIKINLSRQSKMEKQQSLDGVILQIDHSVAELRRIARNMMPESLLRVGLEAALRDLCESLERDEMQIEFQAYGLGQTMSASVQAHIYRIVQEILSNAVRHSNASKIIVQCSQNENIFLIDVEDDGKGFDPSGITEGKGIGFANIKNRVEYLKGKIDVKSAVGKGTSIHIELDLTE